MRGAGAGREKKRRQGIGAEEMPEPPKPPHPRKGRVATRYSCLSGWQRVRRRGERGDASAPEAPPPSKKVGLRRASIACRDGIDGGVGWSNVVQPQLSIKVWLVTPSPRAIAYVEPYVVKINDHLKDLLWETAEVLL